MRGTRADGNAIRQLRKSLGLTQEKLAAFALCDVTTIRNAEKGRRLDLGTLKNIADALSIDVSAILRDVESALKRLQHNRRCVHDWQQAFNQRDIDAMLAVYHADAMLTLPGSDEIPGSGIFRGTAQLRRQAELTFECFETRRISPHRCRLHAVDEYVFLRGKVTATVRANGTKFASDVFHEFQFENGQVVKHTGLIDTASIEKALADTPSSD